MTDQCMLPDVIPDLCDGLELRPPEDPEMAKVWWEWYYFISGHQWDAETIQKLTNNVSKT